MSRFADVFRLALLLTEGGIYLDADDRCIGPIDRFLPPGAEAVFYQEPLGSIGNNFLVAAPGNPIIATALNEAIRAVLEEPSGSNWLATGPGLLSRVVAMHIAHSQILALPRGVHIVPQSVFRETIQAWQRARYKRGMGLGRARRFEPGGLTALATPFLVPAPPTWEWLPRNALAMMIFVAYPTEHQGRSIRKIPSVSML